MAFDNIRLEKGLYTTGKSFTQALEELDPSENYVGTPLEGLDAYERQLKRFDIKVSGANSDPVAKFFASTDSSALFPEYIARAVRRGIDSSLKVEDIVATTTRIDGLDYRSIYCDQCSFGLEDIGDGVTLPETSIDLQTNLTKLKKHGRMLVASYEAIKYQKLDLFTTLLKKIGDSISRNEFNDVSLIIEDVAQENSNIIKIDPATFKYKDLLKFWTDLLPYNLNTIIATKNTFVELMSIPEILESNVGVNFNSNGTSPTPFGANVYCDDERTDTMLVGFDKNYAIEKVEAGGVITEFDKLIDRQLERATISTITGFSVIYKDSIKAINLEK